MQISSGAIITDGKKILLGHTTRSTFWSIPKGKVEEDENYWEACVREIREETNINLHSLKTSVIYDLGEFNYLNDKKLYLFKIVVNDLPDVNKLKCNSITSRGFPEFDKFAYFEFDTAIKKMNKNLAKLFEKNNLLY